MSVQGLGQGYGYYPGVVPEKQTSFQGRQAQQMPVQKKKKSFLGGLVKIGLAIGTIVVAFKTGKGSNILKSMAKNNSVKAIWDKAGKKFIMENITRANVGKAAKTYWTFLTKGAFPKTWSGISKFLGLAKTYGVKSPGNLKTGNINFKNMTLDIETVLKNAKT